MGGLNPSFYTLFHISSYQPSCLNLLFDNSIMLLIDGFWRVWRLINPFFDGFVFVMVKNSFLFEFAWFRKTGFFLITFVPGGKYRRVEASDLTFCQSSCSTDKEIGGFYILSIELWNLFPWYLLERKGDRKPENREKLP